MTFDLLILAAAIALNPLPLSLYILLLGSRDGIGKGWGFLVGWIACVVVVILIGVLLTGGRPLRPNTEPSTAALAIRIAAGVALLALAWRQRNRPRGPRKPSRFEARLDQSGFVAAGGIAVLLQPWPMTAAAGATVTRANLAHPATVVILVIFGLLASSSYLAMQVGATLRPEATLARLGGFNQWIEDHRNALLVFLYVAIGLWLIGKSAYLLV